MSAHNLRGTVGFRDDHPALNPDNTTDTTKRNVFGQPRRFSPTGDSDEQPVRRQTLPEGSAERKAVPLCTGVFDYFPAALAAVARISKFGNDKHNPGSPVLYHARGKSMDHADSIARHLVDRGLIDPDTGESHTAELAWRALALLQEEEEARGAPLARAARLPDNPPPER